MEDKNVKVVLVAAESEPIRIGTITHKRLLSREDLVTLRVPTGYIELKPGEAFAMMRALMEAVFACRET